LNRCPAFSDLRPLRIVAVYQELSQTSTFFKAILQFVFCTFQPPSLVNFSAVFPSLFAYPFPVCRILHRSSFLLLRCVFFLLWTLAFSFWRFDSFPNPILTGLRVAASLFPPIPAPCVSTGFMPATTSSFQVICIFSSRRALIVRKVVFQDPTAWWLFSSLQVFRISPDGQSWIAPPLFS